jgi:hypothetical protein
MNEADIKLYSVLVAIISATISIYAAYRSRIASERARQIQAYAFLRQHYADVREWSSEVVEIISEAVMFCDLDPKQTVSPSFFERRHLLRARLSHLLDTGKWFFPNVEHDSFGTHKPAAYRGFRQEALDRGHEVYCAVGALDYTEQAPNGETRKKLVEAKKAFVSIIQEVLDPRKREEEIRALQRSLNDT